MLVSNKYVIAFYAFVVIGYSACSSGPYTEKELSAYVQDLDNELSKQKEYKGTQIKVTYRPTDLLVAQEIDAEQPVDSATLNNLRSKYSNYYYFVLSLSKNDKEALYGAADYNQFSDLVQTLSFRMAAYTNLTTTELDTIPVGDYVFPRTYGMGGATNLMFAFAKEKAQNDDWVQFNLKEFGMGLGNQVFRFDREKLDKAPTIDFKITE